MRLMLHDSYESKLIDLANNKGVSPSQVIRDIILASHKELLINNQECTSDAQGMNNNGTRKKEEF